jgi:Uma2 family endonuclease
MTVRRVVVATEIQYTLQSPDASWSAERWEKLPADGNRYEVIDGVLYMSTTPSVFHQWIINRLIGLVGLPLQNDGVGLAFTGPIGVFMPGCDPVQPDFLLIRNERVSIFANGRVNGVPDLIVEVLSPSHPHIDTTVKRAAYARAGVPEYWIVRPATRDIMVYWQPEQDFGDFAQSRLVAADGVLESPTMPITQRIAEFFAGSPDTTI